MDTNADNELSPAEAARMIAEKCEELEELAEAHGHSLLALLLSEARRQASDELEMLTKRQSLC